MSRASSFTSSSVAGMTKLRELEATGGLPLLRAKTARRRTMRVTVALFKPQSLSCMFSGARLRPGRPGPLRTQLAVALVLLEDRPQPLPASGPPKAGSGRR